jgi:leucyl aminopeptidase
VVGKGLLFDTGGYNIKTQMMELMKFDCGGAAAVLGAAKAIDSLAPKGIEVHFIIAACEVINHSHNADDGKTALTLSYFLNKNLQNMISAKAYVPSDVLTASNSKTIEVYNTDAEGRLTLADALVYADKTVGCEKIIELSTLTGACIAALGKQIAGVFTESDDLAQELDLISKATGEKTWRMPMEQEYSEQIESIIADLKNCGTKYGGAITAALFLQHFVDPQKPFAHIDIAGELIDTNNCILCAEVTLIAPFYTTCVQ